MPERADTAHKVDGHGDLLLSFCCRILFYRDLPYMYVALLSK